MKAVLFILLSLSLSHFAIAVEDPDLKELKLNKEYYLIKNAPYKDQFGIVHENKINLLVWERVKSTPPTPTPAYQREASFGRFVTVPNDTTCKEQHDKGKLDTRAKALERDSKVAVTVSRTCTVTEGKWHDPYTNEIYENGSDMDVDHIVALKHAYFTGAYKWSSEKRCTYANFLENDYHLLSVQNRENRVKSDRAPHQYVPPNEAYTCKFLGNWLKVKAVWGLIITEREGKGISDLISTHSCTAEDFLMDKDHYEDMIKKADIVIPGCAKK